MLWGSTWKQYIFYSILQDSLANSFLKSCWQWGLVSLSLFLGVTTHTYHPSSIRLFVILVFFFFLARGRGIAFVLSLGVTTPLITPVVLSKKAWHFNLYFKCDIPTYYPSYLIFFLCVHRFWFWIFSICIYVQIYIFSGHLSFFVCLSLLLCFS